MTLPIRSHIPLTETFEQLGQTSGELEGATRHLCTRCTERERSLRPWMSIRWCRDRHHVFNEIRWSTEQEGPQNQHEI